jgi:hypothetical protein
MTQEIRAFNELSEDIFLITLSSRFAWVLSGFSTDRVVVIIFGGTTRF